MVYPKCVLSDVFGQLASGAGYWGPHVRFPKSLYCTADDGGDSTAQMTSPRENDSTDDKVLPVELSLENMVSTNP